MKHRSKALGALLTAGLLVGANQQAQAADPVAGAGSSFAGKILNQWITDTQPSGVQVSYTATGSGDGKAKFADKAVDFGASDVAATKEEAAAMQAAHGEFVYIPVTGGGISAVYNVAEFADLKLSGPTLAKIFSGAITNWNDPAVTADNGQAGPDRPITVVYRKDLSGSSFTLTEYLTAAGEGNWKGGATEQFPGPAGGKAVEGGSAVAAEVTNTPGAISYTDHGGAISKQLDEVRVKNPAGEFKGPEEQAVQSALVEATTNPDGTVSANFTPKNAKSYPILAVTYMLAPTKVPAAKAETFKAFFDYGFGAGQDKAPGLGYARFPAKLLGFAKGQAAKITAG